MNSADERLRNISELSDATDTLNILAANGDKMGRNGDKKGNHLQHPIVGFNIT